MSKTQNGAPKIPLIAGYTDGGSTPDFGWWDTQIKAGERWRDEKTYADRWKVWDAFYRNDYGAMDMGYFGSSQFMVINLFFMMARTLIPRLYFRNPSVSVLPAQPGAMHMGLSAVAQRVLNRLIASMNLKSTMRDAVQQTFFTGNGPLKLGYGVEYVPTGSGSVASDTGPDKPRSEWKADVLRDQPWVGNVPTGHYVLPAGTKNRLAAPWEAHIVFRDVDALRRDDRLANAKEINATYKESEDVPETDESRHTVGLVKIIEVHDRRTGKVFAYAPEAEESKRLLFGPELDEMQSQRGGPMYNIVFNAAQDTVWGLPDGQILEPYQREANEIATQIQTHRRITTRKLRASEDVKTEELDAVVNGLIGAAIRAEPNTLEVLQTGGIPPELFTALDRLFQIVQVTMGFSRNQFGEYKQGSESPSATEASIIQQASEIRVDERRDMIADVLLAIVQDMLKLVVAKWDTERIERVIGPYGVPVWVAFKGRDLGSGAFDLTIDPDSSLPETKERREAKATAVMQQLFPLTQQINPLTGMPYINGDKLIRFYLHELNGVYYDDMLFGVPNIFDESMARVIGGGNGGPMSPEALGQSMMAMGPGGEALSQMIMKNMQRGGGAQS